MVSLYSCEFLSFILSIGIIDLGSSDVTGTIPTQLGCLPDLEDLLLDSIGLTGTIPSQIGKVKS